MLTAPFRATLPQPFRRACSPASSRWRCSGVSGAGARSRERDGRADSLRGLLVRDDPSGPLRYGRGGRESRTSPSRGPLEASWARGARFAPLEGRASPREGERSNRPVVEERDGARPLAPRLSAPRPSISRPVSLRRAGLAARSSREEDDRASPEVFLGARPGRWALESPREPATGGRPRGGRREGGVVAATCQSTCRLPRAIPSATSWCRQFVPQLLMNR